MPICCEPGERFPIVLAGDRGKTPEPTFWCRHLSARRFRELTALGARLAEMTDLGQQLELLNDGLQMAICGWDNLVDRDGTPLPYDPSALLDVLTVAEGSELLRQIAIGQHLSGADLKNYGSPSPSDSGSIAAAAGQGAAEIAPAPNSP